MKTKSLSTLCFFTFLAIYGNAVCAQSVQVPSADCPELSTVKARLQRVESYLKDWPNLGRYRDSDAGVAPPAKNERRVVFIGDSITDFWDNPGYGGFFPGKHYVNRGISGQITPQLLIRFRPDVIALQPKAVVILAGTNDIAGDLGPLKIAEVKDNIASMAELARAHGISVIIASLLPVNDYKHTRDGQQLIRTTARPSDRIKSVNDWIEDYVRRNNHIYLNYYKAVVDEKGMLKEDLTDDGVHPNARGYAVMAPLAEGAIESALKGW